MKLSKYTVYIYLILLLTAQPSYAVKRLKKAIESYNKEYFRSALSKTEDYLSDYPQDNLGLDMKDMIVKKLAAINLKKGYTLKAEGEENLSSENIQNAIDLHPGYSGQIEDRYEEMLKTRSREEAANNIILYMLRSPIPDESEEYELGRRIRKRYASTLSETERMSLEELKDEVNKLAEDKKFNKAVELIMGFINNNPSSSEAKLLLTEINRKAAQYFYTQAQKLIKSDKINKGRKEALLSKKYAPQWFQQKIEKSMEEAKMSIVVGDRAGAKSKLKMLSHLNPEDPGPSLYLSLFEEEKTGFLQRSIELYKNKQYEEAMIRFDFLRLSDPENNEAQLYYHMSAARKYIRTQNLKKVKEHLIAVLKIAPDEKEALDIYDRLDDVMEIMGEG
ncbi:MAG: hypothetical protein PF545_02055 [Elusimicrobia bacterium]|jgi:hypothetical protein|nr:hypothetical protein [Elusimicrobiota bacterium]